MINVAVLGFIAGPPLEGTQHIDLTNQQTANEEVILPNSEKEEFVRELEVVDLEEDFDVFSRPKFAESSSVSSRHLFSAQISSNQETTNIPEAMVLQRKNTSLLELLESHAGGTTLEVVVNPRLSTPLPSQISPTEPPKKKRKIYKKLRKEMSKEGEIHPIKDQDPPKGARTAKRLQRRSSVEGSSAKAVSDRRLQNLMK